MDVDLPSERAGRQHRAFEVIISIPSSLGRLYPPLGAAILFASSPPQSDTDISMLSIRTFSIPHYPRLDILCIVVMSIQHHVITFHAFPYVGTSSVGSME